MTAIDIAAQVRAAALAAVDKACLGEDFGVDTTLVLAPSPGGSVMLVYTLVLTLRSPLLGHPPLFNVVQIPSPHPTAEQVEQPIGEAMQRLRELASKILADGQSSAVVAG